MADISITAANVLPASNAVNHPQRRRRRRPSRRASRSTSTPRTNSWKLADNDHAAAAAHQAAGTALNGASVGQPVAVQKGGDVTIGGTLTAGVASTTSPAPPAASARSPT
jgi:hypothetical protein